MSSYYQDDLDNVKKNNPQAAHYFQRHSVPPGIQSAKQGVGVSPCIVAFFPGRGHEGEGGMTGSVI
jgi:hypothetical protein